VSFDDRAHSRENLVCTLVLDLGIEALDHSLRQVGVQLRLDLWPQLRWTTDEDLVERQTAE
jgi:hypothetical protein